MYNNFVEEEQIFLFTTYYFSLNFITYPFVSQNSIVMNYFIAQL